MPLAPAYLIPAQEVFRNSNLVIEDKPAVAGHGLLVVRRYEPQPALGAALRELRERRTMTQAEVARRADVEPTWLSRIESGSANPSWGTVRRICKALDTTLGELVVLLDSTRP